MEIINKVILVTAIAVCLILMAYFIRWTAWKRIKPSYLRRNIVTFGWSQAIILITALAVNNIIIDINGAVGKDLYALVPIAAALILCLMCRETLIKNFEAGVKSGEKCIFCVANVYERELQGYAVLNGNNWLPAKTEIAYGTAKEYEEHQQIEAFICSGTPDDKFIVVRI